MTAPPGLPQRDLRRGHCASSVAFDGAIRAETLRIRKRAKAMMENPTTRSPAPGFRRARSAWLPERSVIR